MNIAPIFTRELKRAANRPLLYWLRGGSVLAGVAVGIFLLKGTEQWSSGTTVGRNIFELASWGAFMLCLLSGVLLTAGIVCDERRDGALALLFLTDLKGFDILAGKLAAVGFLACQIVLGLFPLFALCIVLGGVSLAEFWRTVQVLLVTLLFSLSSGLFVSALTKHIARSVLFTFAFIVMITTCLALADWAAAERISLPVGMIVPGLISALNSIADSAYVRPPQNFELSLAYWVVFSILLLALGGLMLKRLSLQDEDVRSRQRVPLPIERKRQERRRLLRENPVYWLGARHRSGVLGIWSIFTVLMVIWVGFLYVYDFSDRVWALAIFGFGPILHLLLKITIAAEAVKRLGDARNNELELLLVTPLRGAKILHGHYKAVLRSFVFPVAMIVLLDLLFALCYRRHGTFPARESAVAYLFIYTLGISLVVDLPTLVWRGLWNGLQCHNPVQAVRRTLLDVVVFPVPVILLTMMVPAFLIGLGNEISALTGYEGSFDAMALVAGAIMWWWFVAFILNIALQKKARFNLGMWLRPIVADPAGCRRRLEGKRIRGPQACPG